MAMNRAQMLSIINALADDKLTMALNAAGVDIGADAMDMGKEDEGALAPWSEQVVQVAPPNKPNLFDKNKFVKQPLEVVRRPAYMPRQADEGMDDLSAYVTPDGMI